jgi:alpha-beta hydrolase superfamily lysophospholipase
VALGEALTVNEEVIGDALAALDLLRRRPRIDPQALFVLGHSLGGTVAPRIAERSKVKGVIVLAGLTRPLPETALEQTRYLVSLDSVVTDEEQARVDEIERAVATLRAGLNGTRQVEGYVLGAPLAYYRDLEQHDAPFELARTGLPCLVVGGGRDYQVTHEDFVGWQQALANQPQACLREIEEMDHLLRLGTGPSSPNDYETPRPVAAGLLDLLAGWIRSDACPP